MADSARFFEKPVLNSPYDYPQRHWRLDENRQPADEVNDARRPAEYITPIPKPRKQKDQPAQKPMVLDEGKGLSTEDQEYDPTSTINVLRRHVDRWRALPNPTDWQVTPETARLLRHWRSQDYRAGDIRPFFCQVEAVETVIWLTEVAPKRGIRAREILERLKAANEQANPELARLALKMATGAGKTTVMAMLIAWQTVNAIRRPTSRNFTKGFLIVTPGLTIRDRLRVLQPNDPDNYYENRNLVPQDMLRDLRQAKIVITNYHAFKLRETLDLSKGGRRLLQGRGGTPIESTETEGQMLQRVMPELMGMRGVIAFNDEAHHCYREKPGDDEEGKLTGDDRKEAEENREAARLWISGLEAVNDRLGLQRVIDLSATPFFLRGSGYAEGTLFPWTMTDFSLMDAIECGIVKLPRVPVADDVPAGDMPVYRNLWEHIRSDMPKKGRSQKEALDPLKLPPILQSALDALYSHYEKTFDLWEQAATEAPPCFIIVCNNTSTSKLVYDYVSGFHREREDGSTAFVNGRLPLFRNFDDQGEPAPRPRTLLIDSTRIESGEAIDANFRKAAADEIERFRRDQVQRTGDRAAADKITDEDLLREVMNTVGKPGQLGGSIRCVVSVSMLTEGWDANTVTHVLGVRAFGTQLLCEQVVGRALRRQSYDLDEDGLFPVEYADVLGIPFDFTAKPIVAPPTRPREVVTVEAVSPERDHLEIHFPRVEGYRVDLPEETLRAEFNADSTLVLTTAETGPSETVNRGILGAPVNLRPENLAAIRKQTVLYSLTHRLLETKYRDADGEPKLHLFGKMKRIAAQWLDHHLVCKGGTWPAHLLYQELADMACERIATGVSAAFREERPIKAVLAPYNPTGSTQHVRFTTSKTDRYETDPDRCHINFAICDSDWEAEFCRVAEKHPRVRAYVKNHALGFEVPYLRGMESHRYIPDFIVRVDDGHGEDDLLNLVVEIKGYRGEDAKQKKLTMETYWVPGVNNLGTWGRWAFAEFTDPFEMEKEFAAVIENAIAEAGAATPALSGA